MISLYFHLPFCTKKCPYCHFYVVPNRPLFHSLLEEGLALEWEQKLPSVKNKQIASVYFGGGTPSLFPADSIEKILKKIQRDCSLAPDCEITIEANPEEGSRKLFEAFRAIGINRLSLGVQSLDDRSLQTIERTHSAKQALEAILHAHEAGFDNISIDLMYDLPDQSLSSWLYTLQQVDALPITHLSLYNLTIEPHTSFYKRKQTLKQPEPQLSLDCLQYAVKALEQSGLHRYEISAFARRGKIAKHNVGYWTGRPFLGYGPSAFSYWDQERFRNIAHLQRYLRLLKEGLLPEDFREKLTEETQAAERLAIALRLLEGVDVLEHASKIFCHISEQTQKALIRCIEEGYLAQEGSRVALTPKGLLFYDTVAEALI